MNFYFPYFIHLLIEKYFSHFFIFLDLGNRLIFKWVSMRKFPSHCEQG